MGVLSEIEELEGEASRNVGLDAMTVGLPFVLTEFEGPPFGVAFVPFGIGLIVSQKKVMLCLKQLLGYWQRV